MTYLKNTIVSHVLMKVSRRSTHLLLMPLTERVNYAAICVNYATFFHNIHFYGILNIGIQENVLFQTSPRLTSFHS